MEEGRPERFVTGSGYKNLKPHVEAIHVIPEMNLFILILSILNAAHIHDRLPPFPVVTRIIEQMSSGQIGQIGKRQTGSSIKTPNIAKDSRRLLDGRCKVQDREWKAKVCKPHQITERLYTSDP